MLGELDRHEEAIEAYDKAIEINPQDAAASSYSGALLFNLGNLDEASQKVQDALNIDENLTSALSLKGRIKIEEKDYDAASKCFRRAISLDAGNPSLLLWDAYANYLKAEFSLKSKDEKYQEEIASIVRSMERADKLSKKYGKGIRPYILYFLGYFYYKSKDIFTAKEKLKECVKECTTLKSVSPIAASARELLNNIWNYQIRPPWWRWWLDSPLDSKRRKAIFVIISLFIFALLMLHPFIPLWFPSVYVSWPVYVLLGIFLMLVLTSPSIERIRAREIVEVEIYSPPPSELVLSPAIMEQKLEEIEKYLEPELLEKKERR